MTADVFRSVDRAGRDKLSGAARAARLSETRRGAGLDGSRPILIGANEALRENKCGHSLGERVSFREAEFIRFPRSLRPRDVFCGEETEGTSFYRRSVAANRTTSSRTGTKRESGVHEPRLLEISIGIMGRCRIRPSAGGGHRRFTLVTFRWTARAAVLQAGPLTRRSLPSLWGGPQLRLS